MGVIGYVMLGTNDVARAGAFYDAVLGSVGIGRLTEFARGPAYGVSWDKPLLAVCGPFDGQPATAGNGTMISIVVDSREKVDVLHGKALALGAVDEGAPGLRGPDGPSAFYGGYFRDPDGNKLCVFIVGQP